MTDPVFNSTVSAGFKAREALFCCARCGNTGDDTAHREFWLKMYWHWLFADYEAEQLTEIATLDWSH